jgi:polyhydroxyalkanoic acid synthase PhaR subunit
MWTGALPSGSSNFMDPWGLYRQWSEGMENMRGQMMRGMGSMNSIGGGNGSGGAAATAWQKGVDATMENWRKSAEMSTEMMGMAPRWMEMLDQTRENLMAVERYPKDPLEFAVQWYNATSGPYSEFVQDIVEREEFLEQGSKFLQNYAGFYKIFKRQSEEYLHNVQIPTRSDITRVASLVVALEEKVDNIEDTVEEMGESQAASLADGKISDIEKHLGKVEKKVEKTEDKIEKRLDKLEDKLAKRSDKANDGMEKRLGDLEGKLDGISTAIERPADTSATDGLGERINRVEGKLDSISTAVDRPADTSASDSLSGRMDEVENKLDQLIAILQQPTDTSATDDLDERVDEVEGKHDQLLSSLGDLGPNAAGDDDAPTEEPPTSNAPANASASTSANTTVNVPEIKATDAARRKANDMDVNLAEVNGTGADGQITVEDVRKKGDS